MRFFCSSAIILLLLLAGLSPEARGEQQTAPTVAQPAGESADSPATPPATPPVQPPLTSEAVESLRKAAAESSELDDDTKKKAAEICRAALAQLQLAADLTSLAAKSQADADTIEQRVADTKQQLEVLKGREPARASGATLAELEHALSKLELQIETLQKSQSAAEAEPKTRAQRRKEIRGRLVAIPVRLTELQQQAAALPADEHTLVATARKSELAAQQLALQREVPALENELAKYDAEDAADLVRLQRDLCTQQVALAKRQLELLNEQIKTARSVAAEQAVRKARDEAINAEPVLKSYAERNRQLAEAAKSVTEKFDTVDLELKTAKEEHDKLLRQFDQTRKKVESVGLTSSIGAMLRKQRAALPGVRKRRAAVSNRQAIIDEAQYELFEYDDERQELANRELPLRRILSGVGASRSKNPELLEAAARELLDRKCEYLDSLIRNYNKYFDTLIDLDTTEQQLITLAQRYGQYIDERVLWIRSGKLLASELQFDQSDAWFVSSHRWQEVPQQLAADALRNPVPYGLAVFLLAVLALRGKSFRRELRAIGEASQRPTCREFVPTLRCVALTVAVAGLWPGLFAFVAWRLHLAANGAAFAKAVGYGLACGCAMWLPLELVRQACRPKGLADAHFGWPSSATLLLRRSLRWLILLGLPLTFVTSTFLASDPTHGRDAVERTCFILQAIVLAVFLRHVLRPQNGVFQEYIAFHKGGWIDRLKMVWYWLGVAAPMLLAGLAFWGYYYTAQVLSWRLHATMCFVSALVLVRALLLRLILLRRRKLSMQQARERAAAAASGAHESAAATAGIVTDEPQAALSAHSEQTQRLLTTGMLATTLIGFWLIWVEVLPALTMLDRWPLWTTTSSVQVVEQNAPAALRPPTGGAAQDKPATSVRTEFRTSNVTFSDLALAVLITVITFVSARNVPGLLEMSVLQRLPLDASVRYAVTTLVSYGIVLLGVIAACSSIGLRWSQIQWLATALTFGLAFGLQEIFANFVAGLIILFERPVRVGDVVTVDDVTGIVSRIRIRATSITNWDRKEYVVPNREFITGRLLNWTLSDKVNRIVIEVGVAYGSDTQQAIDLLLQAANEHPMILRDPPSIATFEGFGDNSLNLTLRTYLPTLDNRLKVVHELYTSINQAFRQAGIEIAFPQRDLHIRTVSDARALGLGGTPEQKGPPASSQDAQREQSGTEQKEAA